MREVDFSARTIAQRWRQVKGFLREDLTVWTRHLLKRVSETCLEEGLELYLCAAPMRGRPRGGTTGTAPTPGISAPRWASCGTCASHAPGAAALHSSFSLGTRAVTPR